MRGADKKLANNCTSEEIDPPHEEEPFCSEPDLAIVGLHRVVVKQLLKILIPVGIKNACGRVKVKTSKKPFLNCHRELCCIISPSPQASSSLVQRNWLRVSPFSKMTGAHCTDTNGQGP